MGTLQEQLQKIVQREGIEISPPTPNTNEEKVIEHLENISLNREAQAPYNFIPLNESVVEGETFLQNDRYHDDRLTGYIDCGIKTLTPIYIRDTYTEDDLKRHNEAERKGGKEKHIVPDFFSPADSDNIRIPGSSLRGMIRTLVEMVSWSKFGFFEDRGLYYRGLADKSNLRDEYQENMVDKNDYHYSKIRAGFLRKDGHNYKIIPSKDSNGCQIYRVPFDRKTKVVDGLERGLNEFTFEEVYFQQVLPKLHPHAKKLKYVKVTSVSRMQDKDHPTKGFLVSSGLFGEKKHMHWLINEPDTSIPKIVIPETDIENYTKDADRKDKAALLEKCKDHSRYPNGVPCFYIEWKDSKGNTRISFGHTGMFRLAYERSIGEHLPGFLQDKSKVDIAEAIFGKVAEKGEDSFAGRVFFEDAVLLNPEKDPLMEESIPQILSTPKPTTFQHYLVQNSNDIRNLNHYNSQVNIRGNKLYWHKSGEKWQETDTTFSTQHTKIRPVKPEIEFKFRIRFENLSEIELGALLFVLSLPAGCAHKIGLGKPLGLGSIEITPTLVLSDRRERYKSLFEGDRWSLPEKNGKTIHDYISDFEKYILNNINDKEKKNASSLWKTPRLRQLKTMLDVERGKKLEKLGKIEYMQMQEFKDRRILPIPEKV